MKDKAIRYALLSAMVAALPGVAFSKRNNTVPPIPDIKAAYDSIVKSEHFGEAQSLDMMKVFLERYPASSYVPEVTLMMADRYFLDGVYPLAYTTYSRLAPEMFSGETRKRYTYRYAYSMIKTGYYSGARTLMRSLLNDDKYGNAALFYTAYLDYIKGDYDKAYEGFKKVRSNSERGLEAEYYINQIDFARGDYRKVTDRGRRLLAGNVDYQLRPETMKVTGISHYKLGEVSKARPLLEEYVELKGDGADDTAVYTLGTILYDEGKYDKAEALFSSLTDDRGDIAQSAWLYLGQIQAARGDDQAAALAFDRAARESWDTGVSETAAFNLAVASATGSRLPFADSARQMEAFINDYPDSPYARTLSRYLVNAYYNQHDYAKALEALETLSDNDRETVILRQKVNYQYGVEQLRSGNTATAIAALSKAAAGADREVAAQASLWLGDAYYGTGDYSRVAKAYGDAASSKEIGSNAALAYYDLGYAQMKLKNYKAAQTAFDNALKKGGLSASQKTDALLRRADCLYYTGNYTQALKEFKEAAKGGGSDAVYAAIREGDILGREGKVKEKIDILQTLADSGNSGVWTTTVLQRLGDAYSENGQDSKAATVYARMLDSGSGASDNEKAQLYYSLAGNAEKLYNSGNILEALEVYKRLESSSIPEIYYQGVVGIMRASDNPSEIVEYSDKARKLPGVSADLTEEAGYLKAKAMLDMGATDRQRAVTDLEEMSKNCDSEWGAKAALALGSYYLANGEPTKAEQVLLRLTDSGCEDSNLLARGYIMLSDACVALDKSYLAKLYLETLRSNYPGDDKNIFEMIDSRLKKMK